MACIEMACGVELAKVVQGLDGTGDRDYCSVP